MPFELYSIYVELLKVIQTFIMSVIKYLKPPKCLSSIKKILNKTLNCFVSYEEKQKALEALLSFHYFKLLSLMF